MLWAKGVSPPKYCYVGRLINLLEESFQIGGWWESGKMGSDFEAPFKYKPEEGKKEGRKKRC